MRSSLTTLAPAACVASSMCPSTCAGTPDSIRLGPAPLSTRFVELWDGLAVVREELAAATNLTG